MGKSFTAIIFFFIMVILAMLLVSVEKNKKRNLNDIGTQLILGIIINLVYIGAIFVKDREILNLFYSIVQILEMWILYLFLRYAGRHTDFVKKHKTLYRVGAIVLITADSCMLLLNAFTQWFFKLNLYEYEEFSYIGAEWSPFYLIHHLLLVFCEIMIAVILLSKAFHVAKIYQAKYIIGSGGFAVLFIAESCFRIWMNNSNIASVVLMSAAVVGYYYMYFRLPYTRLMRMKNYAINKMADPVLMFDYEDKLQVYNEAAREMLGVEELMPFREFVRANALSYDLRHNDNEEKKDVEFTRTSAVGRKTYLIHGQELWDDHKTFVGTLLTYSDISGQERLKDEATLYATRDTLTGLWNRDYFFEMVDKTLRENPKEEFMMVGSDVYQFKIFNEILGTRTGDDLLLAIAQGYRERSRRLWVFSRISSDRFALFLPKADFDEKRFLAFCHEVFNRKNFSLKVHFYLGVYEVTDRSISAKSMYDRAFITLETIKGDLQKEIAYYHEEILNRRIFETTTVDEMDRALLNNEFVIFLQPQIDILTNKIVSAEALVRWNKPGRGIIYPGEFIPLFENHGMIAKLDYYVWELACKQLAMWKENGHEERSISVNVSAKDFYLTDLYDSLTSLIERYEIKAKNLKLEITETAFVLDIQKQMELVRKLQDYGFLIEIDDFGSGYSSLNSLKDICVDILKMDLRFFEKTDDTDRAERIVESVINLANDLGMPVIAEGVETEEDLMMLKKLGCQIIQGYLLAKPMPVSDFEAFINEYDYEDVEEVLERVQESIRELKKK